MEIEASILTLIITDFCRRSLSNQFTQLFDIMNTKHCQKTKYFIQVIQELILLSSFFCFIKDPNIRLRLFNSDRIKEIVFNVMKF